MNPVQHYLKNYVDLYKHIDDAAYVRHQERFASWYEGPIELPGRVYLLCRTARRGIVRHAFRANMFKGDPWFVLGFAATRRELQAPRPAGRSRTADR